MLSSRALGVYDDVIVDLQSKMGGKYEIEIYEDEPNVKTLSLKVVDIRESDYGVYTCVASNNLGRASAKMILECKCACA